MSNYFSMGVESRIGIGFDKRRTTSKFGNKWAYFTEGLKKSFLSSTPKVEDLINSMIRMSDQASADPMEFVAKCAECENERGTLVFSTRSTTEAGQPVLSDCASLIAINIPSFASGNDIWANAVGRTAFGGDEDLCQARQVMGDGMLEFLGFASAASLGLEVAIKGNGRRVHQGSGPWKLNFHPLGPKVKTYFQVDGEFFIATRPDFVGIRRTKQIQVLAHGDISVPYFTLA
eukprot:GHVN01036415.1.p1 GENE.GHVN01036415.1~~GHVN01036415.1.p1  ORF type:complete len:232 (-),score=12.88 GHVN01036415.1:112-807(-)